jgi:isopenicillin-N epimerase
MASIPLPEYFQGRPKRAKIDPEQLRLYDEFAIEVPFFHIGKTPHRYFRISAQVYNSLAEYRYLAAALQKL